jgi:hypothetical protein
MFSLNLPIGTVKGSSRKEQTIMEISPVPGIRIAPMIRPKEAELGMTDVYEVERTTRTGDEIYIPSGTKAASGFEEEEDKYDELEEDIDEEPRARTAGIGKISRFA